MKVEASKIFSEKTTAKLCYLEKTVKNEEEIYIDRIISSYCHHSDSGRYAAARLEQRKSACCCPH